MIKVDVNKKDIIITGHANFAEYGKDIVCASASSIVITSINACLRIDNKFLIYKEEKDKLTITIKGNNKDCLLIIDNMLKMLEELALTYKKNIEVRRK